MCEGCDAGRTKGWTQDEGVPSSYQPAVTPSTFHDMISTCVAATGIGVRVLQSTRVRLYRYMTYIDI